jgi:hypothetical protein
MNRCQMALPATNLDVVTMYRVITHFQRIQSEAFALADLQPVKIVGCAISQTAPFVQLGVITRRNHAAIAHQYRRRIDNCSLQQLAQFAELAHFFAQRLHWRAFHFRQLRAQFRQLLESVTHTRQVARTCSAQRQTCQNTLQIAHLTQHRLQLAAVILQCTDGLLAFRQHFCIADRHMQPAFQHTATHWCYGAIKYRGQCIFHAASQVLRDLQITARRGVHNDGVLLALHGDRANMRQGRALSVFDIL